MSTITAEAYTSEQAIEAAGITYRQLDYWDRVSGLRPSLREATGRGRGRTRCWSAQDVAALRVCARLAGLGARGPVLGAVYRWLHDLPADMWDDELVVYRDGTCQLGTPVRGAAWVVDLADQPDTDHHP